MDIRCGLVLMAALCASGSFAGGDFDATGAWAYADDPGVARVVFSNKTIWTLVDGTWTPTFNAHEDRDGVHFSPDRVEEGVSRMLVRPERWYFKGPEKDTVKFSPGDAVLVDRHAARRIGDRITFDNARKMVKTSSPDFGFDIKPYIGYWKPAVPREEKEDYVEAIKGSDIRIRADGRAVFMRKKFIPTSLCPGPGVIVRTLPVDGWLRIDHRDEYPGSRDAFNTMLEAFWIAPNGHLLYFMSRDSPVEFVRSENAFDDPIDAQRNMASTGKFHGVWGVGSGFDIFTLAFDRGGKGMIRTFIAVVPFEWTHEGNGRIRCVTDAVMRDVFDMPESPIPAEFTCEYDSETNFMKPAGFTGQRLGGHDVLPFRPEDNVQVVELMRRLEESKKDPEFFKQLERMKRELKRR